MSNSALVYAHDLASQPMTLEDWFSKPRLLDEASRYAVWHLVIIIDPLKQVIEYLSDAAMMINLQKSTSIVDIPNLWEFYTFLSIDRKYVLRKKRWP